MKENVGITDKRVRTAIGAVLGTISLATLAGTVSLPGIAALAFGIGALLMLGTASMGTCPVYSVLGVDTCPVSTSETR